MNPIMSPFRPVRELRTTKLRKLRLAVLTIAPFVLPLWPVDAAKIQDCTWCHGTSAQGLSTAPRLAGQRHQYIQKQLQNFGNHTRDNPFSKQYMWGAAAALNPRTTHDLALYFSTLSPKAAGDGDRELAALGKTLYDLGSADLNIPSCAVCHGPNAEGIRDIPRLAGLSSYYLKRRLEEWVEGYHAGADFPMPRVATTLSAGQIDALAAYLSFAK
jgi:cytochrome c553